MLEKSFSFRKKKHLGVGPAPPSRSLSLHDVYVVKRKTVEHFFNSLCFVSAASGNSHFDTLAISAEFKLDDIVLTVDLG
jgi:hypothetical protein